MATREELSGVVSELGLDKQNQATIGRLLTHGRLAHAEEAPDGRMHAQVRIEPVTRNGQPQPRRPGLLLVQFPDRQR